MGFVSVENSSFSLVSVFLFLTSSHASLCATDYHYLIDQRAFSTLDALGHPHSMSKGLSVGERVLAHF